MGETLLLDAQQLKRFAALRDGLYQDCCDLQATAVLEPHKRGAAADDAPAVLKAWFKLYHDVNTAFRRRGVGGTVVESVFDLPKGKPIRDVEKWLRARADAAERTVEKLTGEKQEAHYRRDRKVLNILMNGWAMQVVRAGGLLRKMEEAARGANRPLDAIRREARELKRARRAGAERG